MHRAVLNLAVPLNLAVARGAAVLPMQTAVQQLSAQAGTSRCGGGLEKVSPVNDKTP
jgi:hypothetical protein